MNDGDAVGKCWHHTTRASLIWAATTTLLASPLWAQQVRIEGAVVDQVTSAPVTGAVVSDNGRAVAITDNSGRFVISAVSTRDSYIEIRRIGYVATSFELVEPPSVLELRIVLERLAIDLEPIAVEATPFVMPNLRGFEERRRIGFGHFITQEVLERRPSAKVTDFLRVVPSIALGRNPRTGELEFFSRRTVSLGGACQSRLYVDGIWVEGTAVDWVDPSHIAGIEVYRGPSETPIKFSGIGGCGAVVLIWTK